MTYLKRQKINFINSGAVDIIRTAYYIRLLELMKLIFAVLDVSFTKGLTRCYGTKVFFTLIRDRYRVRVGLGLGLETDHKLKTVVAHYENLQNLTLSIKHRSTCILYFKNTNSFLYFFVLCISNSLPLKCILPSTLIQANFYLNVIVMLHRLPLQYDRVSVYHHSEPTTEV